MPKGQGLLGVAAKGPVSQQQRRLMWAASAKPGGVAGVPRSVGKEFAAADTPGKLPKRVKPKGK